MREYGMSGVLELYEVYDAGVVLVYRRRLAQYRLA